MSAMRWALDWLKMGNILGVAPEGTRSGDGRLQKGRPGVVLLAMRSKAPILPVAFYGHEGYKENILRLRKTDFHFVVGKNFHLDARGNQVTSEIRQQMVDEIMYQIASILPPENRGVYSDLNLATEDYLRFE
jgi:1-acyl-sn-glycerol-3-phosphate acyltransferase